MWYTVSSGRRLLRSAALGSAIAFTAGHAQAQERPAPFPVDGQVALHALMSLGDAHLQKLADILGMLATTDAARSGSWERIRTPLAEAARTNVPATLWFAAPSGAYWTVAQGRATANLSDRPYFPRLLDGRAVIGELVVSRSTNSNTAIVAVPVRGRDGSVVGVLGSSVYLDSLSAIIRGEMGGLDRPYVFYAIGTGGVGALNSDPALIFTEPMKLGDEGMRRAFSEMLSGQEGVVTYNFRDSRRTVLYRKSPVSGWWYGFGVVEPTREREVLLGGLFALTGEWSSLGQSGRAAMELAVDDVNRYLAGNAAGIKFVAAIEDTRLDPGVALDKARSLRDRGAQLLIGPQSSAEVAHLRPFVGENGLLLVSPSSTAGSLAIAGDNVFRFTPSDSLEAVAITAMMWEDGARVVVPVWRDDPGNSGLANATRARFGTMGGTVFEGVKYGTTVRDFGTTSAALRAQVRRAVAQQGAAKVAVYLAAFDEAAALFASADSDEVLRSVRWYGSDGAAHSEALLKDPHAAAFAIRVGYPNPVFGMDEGARDIWEPLAARIRTRTNAEPDAFALTVYDAVWVVARGYVASGATLDIEQLKHAFTTAASTQFGATGWTVLNAAGDRKYGDFDFWAVRMVSGVPAWTRIAQYETRTKRVVRR